MVKVIIVLVTTKSIVKVIDIRRILHVEVLKVLLRVWAVQNALRVILNAV